MPAFTHYIGIDYSGAETPTASLKGLRVYLAVGDAPPVEVPPPPSPKRYWTWRGIAEWLMNKLAEDAATLVGIDHGFSFPLRYFETHGLLLDWPAFLDDFQRHWPTDGDHTYVDFVRERAVGKWCGADGQYPLAAAQAHVSMVSFHQFAQLGRHAAAFVRCLTLLVVKQPHRGVFVVLNRLRPFENAPREVEKEQR